MRAVPFMLQGISVRRTSGLSRLLLMAAFAAAAVFAEEDSRTLILAASRAGLTDFIDPATLVTIDEIRVVPPDSVGLNGVAASADGSILYVEGPIPGEPDGCCVLCSIDLITLETKLAAGIPGSASRSAFVPAEWFIERRPSHPTQPSKTGPTVSSTSRKMGARCGASRTSADPRSISTIARTERSGGSEIHLELCAQAELPR